MNPPVRELWLSACISVGVHVTAVWVAAQLGAGALRRIPAKVEQPVLEVIVTEPKPGLTPPVPLPVAPAPAAASVVAKSVAATAPEASVEKPAAPKTPPPVAKAVVPDAPRPQPQPKPERAAAEPRVVISANPPKPVAPVTPAVSPSVAKVENVIPPRAVAAAVVAAAAPAIAAPAPTNGGSASPPPGRSEEGPGTLSLPQYRSNPAPVYPESARRQRQEGVVWLAVEVSERGEALAVAVGQTSGHSVLDEAAMTAVRDWKFVPARQGPRPVAARVEVPVRFRLAN